MPGRGARGGVDGRMFGRGAASPAVGWCCGDARHSSGLWCGGGCWGVLWVVVACGGGVLGWWGGGVGWSCGGARVGVLFSKSPRGRPAESWEPEAANPLNFKTGSGRRFVRSGFGWGGSDGLWVAETLICKVFRTRVSLKSCSGAILDRMVVVVPGVSVV